MLSSVKPRRHTKFCLGLLNKVPFRSVLLLYECSCHGSAHSIILSFLSLSPLYFSLRGESSGDKGTGGKGAVLKQDRHLLVARPCHSWETLPDPAPDSSLTSVETAKLAK